MRESKGHAQWVEQADVKKLSRSRSHLIFICCEQHDSMAAWNQGLEDQSITTVQ